MTQPPPPEPGHGPWSPEEPTQSFGYPQGDQPTQSFPPQGENPPGSAGGYPPPGAPPGEQETQRRSPAVIAAAVGAALLVVAGLVFGGIQIFGGGGGGTEPVAGPDQSQETEQVPADEGVDDEAADSQESAPQEAEPEENGAATEPLDDSEPESTDSEPESTDSEPRGPLNGELYDYLTGVVEVVETEEATWTAQAPGWQPHEDLDSTPDEAYIATFTSDQDEELTLWAVRFDDPEVAVDWAENLVEDRGPSDDEGTVWAIEEEVEDDLQYGVVHRWDEEPDSEVIWWDATGVVRHLSGEAEAARDFYLHVPM